MKVLTSIIGLENQHNNLNKPWPATKNYFMKLILWIFNLYLYHLLNGPVMKWHKYNEAKNNSLPAHMKNNTGFDV